MFGSLKKLFGGKTSSPATSAAETTATSSDKPLPPFLVREPVFDRNGQLSGHYFRLRTPDLVKETRQSDLDQMLLDTLNSSPNAWNKTQAFIPLSSASLELPAIEQMKAGNIVLLIHLAEDAEGPTLGETIERLRLRGMRFGVFRQPRHPAFAKLISLVDCAAIDIGGNEANAARDFSAAVRASRQDKPLRLFACNVETVDDYRFCFQWHYEFFVGKFALSFPATRLDAASNPHKALLLNLMRMVQGDAETAEIAEAMKQDPLLSFRILRYLNSPALGLSHHIDSLGQALIILGRQRLTRWLAVLLFSVREPDMNDWLLVENALTRGRLMEELAAQAIPDRPRDPVFLTGIFSCLDRLLRRPLAEILDDIPLADDIRQALLTGSGPYAPLLALAKASEDIDQSPMENLAQAAGVNPESVNLALLAATAWASEVMEYWE